MCVCACVCLYKEVKTKTEDDIFVSVLCLVLIVYHGENLCLLNKQKMTLNDGKWPHMPVHKWADTQTHTVAHIYPMLSSSMHLCQYICFVWRPQFILLTYFLHQKQSLWQLGKGLILCKYMQITVTHNSIQIGTMQMMFAKQAYWKGPYFPAPSHPTHPSTPLPIPSSSLSHPPLALPYAFAFLKKKKFHLPFPSLQSSLIPSPPFLSLGRPLCPVMLSLVSPNTPTPTLSLSLHSSL